MELQARTYASMYIHGSDAHGRWAGLLDFQDAIEYSLAMHMIYGKKMYVRKSQYKGWIVGEVHGHPKTSCQDARTSKIVGGRHTQGL